jgi:hypothetical protein
VWEPPFVDPKDVGQKKEGPLNVFRLPREGGHSGALRGMKGGIVNINYINLYVSQIFFSLSTYFFIKFSVLPPERASRG